MYTLGRHVSRSEHTMDNRVLCNCNGECLWSPTMRRCVLDDAFFLLVYRFVENLDYFRWILDRFVCGKLSRLVWGCVSMVSVSENVIVWVCLCDALWSTVVTKLLYLCIGLIIVSVFIKYVIIFFLIQIKSYWNLCERAMMVLTIFLSYEIYCKGFVWKYIYNVIEHCSNTLVFVWYRKKDLNCIEKLPISPKISMWLIISYFQCFIEIYYNIVNKLRECGLREGSCVIGGLGGLVIFSFFFNIFENMYTEFDGSKLKNVDLQIVFLLPSIFFFF